MYQINPLCTLTLYHVICQLYFKKMKCHLDLKENPTQNQSIQHGIYVLLTAFYGAQSGGWSCGRSPEGMHLQPPCQFPLLPPPRLPQAPLPSPAPHEAESPGHLLLADHWPSHPPPHHPLGWAAGSVTSHHEWEKRLRNREKQGVR